MKPISGFAYALLLSCFSCGAQTNCGISGSIRFSVEPIHLRAEGRAEIDRTERITSASLMLQNAASLETAFDSPFHSRVIRENEFYLTQATPRSDSEVARFIDGVFTPEVVQVGKMRLASPIVTVIRRKNPLCLLSGLSTGNGGIVFKLLELTW